MTALLILDEFQCWRPRPEDDKRSKERALAYYACSYPARRRYRSRRYNGRSHAAFVAVSVDHIDRLYAYGGCNLFEARDAHLGSERDADRLAHTRRTFESGAAVVQIFDQAAAGGVLPGLSSEPTRRR